MLHYENFRNGDLYMLLPLDKSFTLVVEPVNALTEHVHVNTPNTWVSHHGLCEGWLLLPIQSSGSFSSLFECHVSVVRSVAGGCLAIPSIPQYMYWITDNISVLNIGRYSNISHFYSLISAPQILYWFGSLFLYDYKVIMCTDSHKDKFRLFVSNVSFLATK